jgi:L,D-peptidoglycan transpeptidase YkuD (ErfK/YbiS/YcfS/YnhG family)
MLKQFYFFVFMLILGSSCGQSPIRLNEKWGCQQLLVVKTANMDAVEGQLTTYDWSDDKQVWQVATKTMPMVVGQKGLAWGDGLHDATLNKQPMKREGDRKSPAGMFYLSSLFGYEIGDKTLKMPYIQADSTVFCVDDGRSKYYNRIVDRDTVQKDWQSAEPMLMKTSHYKYGAVVDYNTAKTEVGKGSCIFLHIWGKAGSGTMGCTAIEENAMKKIFSWLDIAKKPMLVQVTEKDYEGLKKRYFLP